QLCIKDCSTTTTPAETYYFFGDCITDCPENFLGYDNKGECKGNCPKGFYAYHEEHVCLDSSQCSVKGNYVYEQSNICISNQQCKDIYLSFVYEETCVNECPKGFFGDKALG
ncbi:MAG: hypothetical protein QF704_17270, partial [Anaerolineales bacterium]|nr:hypothetical protein [Anaerolineales bacterium]